MFHLMEPALLGPQPFAAKVIGVLISAGFGVALTVKGG